MRQLTVLLLFLPFFVSAQELLVNGGFEEKNICSEYKVNCAPEGWIYTVPSYSYFFTDPGGAHNGLNYIGLIAAQENKPFYRSFVRSRLLCQLQKGKLYRIQLSVKSPHPILDSVGLYFSAHDFLFEKRPYQKILASRYFKDGIQKPETGHTGWQRLTLEYIANGQEHFITLGNFKKGGITGETGIEKEKFFFVLFDDVSITPVDPNERLCPGWQKTREEIYAQDERHEHLTKWMTVHKNKPPAVTLPLVTKTLKIDTLLVPDVLFATSSFMLNTRATAVLDSFVQLIQKKGIDSIVVHGHTDAIGEEVMNEELSWRRASTVTAYLQKYVEGPFYTAGWGSKKAVASNSTASGRRRNRRVEIFLYLKD